MGNQKSMNRDQYVAHVQGRHKEAGELTARKSKDYTGDVADPFDTYTIPAATAGITPEQYLISLIAMKLVRVRTLTSAENTNFESVSDSLLDISNYALILDALIESKKL